MLFIGTAPHATKLRHKADNKRCAAKEALLRTFCSSPQEGLVWGRKECVQETDSRLTFWRRLDIITAVLYNKWGVDEF